MCPDCQHPLLDHVHENSEFQTEVYCSRSKNDHWQDGFCMCSAPGVDKTTLLRYSVANSKIQDAKERKRNDERYRRSNKCLPILRPWLSGDKTGTHPDARSPASNSGSLSVAPKDPGQSQGIVGTNRGSPGNNEGSQATQVPQAETRCEVVISPLYSMHCSEPVSYRVGDKNYSVCSNHLELAIAAYGGGSVLVTKTGGIRQVAYLEIEDR